VSSGPPTPRISLLWSRGQFCEGYGLIWVCSTSHNFGPKWALFGRSRVQFPKWLKSINPDKKTVQKSYSLTHNKCRCKSAT
jgi:hypothetical protein